MKGMFTYFKRTLQMICDHLNVLSRKDQCKAKVKSNLQGDVVERLNEHTRPPTETICEVVR